MAIVNPDRPSIKSKGEKRTFDILKKLPDNYVIYYEPVIDDRRPDFVVIAPDLGVLVIEVKGWYLENIAGGNDAEVVLITRGMQRREQHPIEQARGYMWRLVNNCKKHPYLGTLLNKDGRFIFPFGHLAILSNIRQEQMKKDLERDFSLIFRESHTITKDILLKWETSSGEEIKNELKKYFNPTWEFPPLTEEQVKILRAIIRPHIVIQLPIDIVFKRNDSVVIESNNPDVSNELKLLDFKQEENACNIGEGHRIIYGVAGSGKTVLLISRSKLLHEVDEDFKILFLC